MMTLAILKRKNVCMEVGEAEFEWEARKDGKDDNMSCQRDKRRQRLEA
jgi:hypothetical protein